MWILPSTNVRPVQAAGGVFWLTRLSRDREAVIRSAAIGLLAQLMGPGAVATQKMITQVCAPGKLSAVLVGITAEYVKAPRRSFNHVVKLPRNAGCYYLFFSPQFI